jgi:uncharacterized protein (DUF302 family)
MEKKPLKQVNITGSWYNKRPQRKRNMTPYLSLRSTLAVLSLAMALILAGTPAMAQKSAPYSDTKIVKTTHAYKTLVQRLGKAIAKNKMGLVNRASATLGAKRVLGLTIPGNMVIGVYHPRFAVRMLKASIPAGIEAPLRFYVTENADKTATLRYRTPSNIFAPYGSAALDVMARELDVIFAAIAKDTVSPN